MLPLLHQRLDWCCVRLTGLQDLNSYTFTCSLCSHNGETIAPTPSTCTVGLTVVSWISLVGSAMHHPMHWRSQISPHRFNQSHLLYCTWASIAQSNAPTHSFLCHWFNRYFKFCFHLSNASWLSFRCLDSELDFLLWIILYPWDLEILQTWAHYWEWKEE